MVRVTLETLIMGNLPGSSILILQPVSDEVEHDRVLPICIGVAEAMAIGKIASKEKTVRPMTHSLFTNVISQLGGTLSHILIDKVRGPVFYATIFIKRGSETIKIDARPSDAIAIALRAKKPMYVDESVLEVASFPTWVNTPQEQNDVQIEAFHQFVEHVNPEDFLR